MARRSAHCRTSVGPAGIRPGAPCIIPPPVRIGTRGAEADDENATKRLFKGFLNPPANLPGIWVATGRPARDGWKPPCPMGCTSAGAAQRKVAMSAPVDGHVIRSRISAHRIERRETWTSWRPPADESSYAKTRDGTDDPPFARLVRRLRRRSDPPRRARRNARARRYGRGDEHHRCGEHVSRSSFLLACCTREDANRRRRSKAARRRCSIWDSVFRLGTRRGAG